MGKKMYDHIIMFIGGHKQYLDAISQSLMHLGNICRHSVQRTLPEQSTSSSIKLLHQVGQLCNSTLWQGKLNSAGQVLDHWERDNSVEYKTRGALPQYTQLQKWERERKKISSNKCQLEHWACCSPAAI